MGFPNYIPARKKNNEIHARWGPFAYLELLDKKPWNDMWDHRVDYLAFFRHLNLTQDMIRGLSWIVNFMSVWRREYWEHGHWVTTTITIYFRQDPRFVTLSSSRQRVLLQLYEDCKNRSGAFIKANEELMEKLQKLHGYGDEIWFELGL
ncbi:reverse transcriptase [Phytophthora cinnamomi]|uniref:reverse transcriptase n=1 Tax=Phytophthora cinnamomi TaxID=4785 RepID=UPI00355A8C97|nr:reverse transcriptase [Phytophthora cinnamomi]